MVSCPVLTKPLLSLELEIFTGAALGIIMVIGAMELPPDSELSEPIRSSSPPRAPYCQMPYIGLCGFTLVSFCDSAGMIVPVVLVMAVARLHPRLDAAQMRAVGMKAQPEGACR